MSYTASEITLSNPSSIKPLKRIIAKISENKLILLCFCNEEMMVKGASFICKNGKCPCSISKEPYMNWFTTNQTVFRPSNKEGSTDKVHEINWPMCVKCELAMLAGRFPKDSRVSLQTYSSDKCKSLMGYLTPIFRCACSVGNVVSINQLSINDNSWLLGWNCQWKGDYNGVVINADTTPSSVPIQFKPSDD